VQVKRIVVIGGGPAGMMAAIRAGELGQSVTLIEKNPSLGRKLLFSGKGRCNLTNACDLDSFLKRFSHNGDFLRDAFRKFFNTELMRFFEKRGLRLRTERQLRVFPETNSSVSVLKTLERELNSLKVKILLDAGARDIITQDRRVKGVILSNGATIGADRIILATGGMSYAFTGSTGDGLRFAVSSGHRAVEARPGLVPLKTLQKFPARLEGLALKNIKLSFSAGATSFSSETGELIFTSFGVSGPLVLTLSGRIIDLLEKEKGVRMEIDFKPALTEEQLHARLLREFKENSKKSIKGVLYSLLPKKMAIVFLEVAGIAQDKKVSHLVQAERLKIVKLLKGFPLNIVASLPLEEAMVTRGGVSLKDINPRTMESRLIKGLYFAGEMIDIDADTGGFNLQAAFSTGFLSGESAALS